jgi:trehalose/maltose hydrolase-like predicted phosphorylase
VGYPLAYGIATFWASRVRYEAPCYVIDGVVPPDEYAFGNNSAYTNVVAMISLMFGVEVLVLQFLQLPRLTSQFPSGLSGIR